MILRVTYYGEPILRQKGENITTFNDALSTLAKDMIDTMHENEGAGLAAQQIDKALQLFVMDIGGDGGPVDFDYTYDGRVTPLNLLMPMAICNPSLELLSEESELGEEGCLSFPGMYLENVPRSPSIRMKFQDLKGEVHTLECDGFLARCCQHEYDHLQGKLFIDRADKLSVRKHESKLKRLKRDSKQFLKQRKSEG